MSKYTINGNEYPSVTTITGQLDKSPALMGWATKCMQEYIELNLKSCKDIPALIKEARFNYREISKTALNIGSQVHDLIEKYIKTDKTEFQGYPDKVQKAFLAFLEWENNNIDKWIESEKPVFDPDRCYAGTLDAIAKFKDGETRVIDFKTSKAHYKENSLQIAAYLLARIKCNNTTNKIKTREGSEYEVYYPEIYPDGMGILRLDKLTGEPEWKEYTNIESAFSSFLDLLDFYYDFRNRRVKNRRTNAK
jgi:hypothetical protein